MRDGMDEVTVVDGAYTKCLAPAGVRLHVDDARCLKPRVHLCGQVLVTEVHGRHNS